MGQNKVCEETRLTHHRYLDNLTLHENEDTSLLFSEGLVGIGQFYYAAENIKSGAYQISKAYFERAKANFIRLLGPEHSHISDCDKYINEIDVFMGGTAAVKAKDGEKSEIIIIIKRENGEGETIIIKNND